MINNIAGIVIVIVIGIVTDGADETNFNVRCGGRHDGSDIHLCLCL